MILLLKRGEALRCRKERREGGREGGREKKNILRITNYATCKKRERERMQFSKNNIINKIIHMAQE